MQDFYKTEPSWCKRGSGQYTEYYDTDVDKGGHKGWRCIDGSTRQPVPPPPGVKAEKMTQNAAKVAPKPIPRQPPPHENGETKKSIPPLRDAEDGSSQIAQAPSTKPPVPVAEPAHIPKKDTDKKPDRPSVAISAGQLVIAGAFLAADKAAGNREATAQALEDYGKQDAKKVIDGAKDQLDFAASRHQQAVTAKEQLQTAHEEYTQNIAKLHGKLPSQQEALAQARESLNGFVDSFKTTSIKDLERIYSNREQAQISFLKGDINALQRDAIFNDNPLTAGEKSSVEKYRHLESKVALCKMEVGDTERKIQNSKSIEHRHKLKLAQAEETLTATKADVEKAEKNLNGAQKAFNNVKTIAQRIRNGSLLPGKQHWSQHIAATKQEIDIYLSSIPRSPDKPPQNLDPIPTVGIKPTGEVHRDITSRKIDGTILTGTEYKNPDSVAEMVAVDNLLAQGELERQIVSGAAGEVSTKQVQQWHEEATKVGMSKEKVDEIIKKAKEAEKTGRTGTTLAVGMTAAGVLATGWAVRREAYRQAIHAGVSPAEARDIANATAFKTMASGTLLATAPVIASFVLKEAGHLIKAAATARKAAWLAKVGVVAAKTGSWIGKNAAKIIAPAISLVNGAKTYYDIYTGKIVSEDSRDAQHSAWIDFGASFIPVPGVSGEDLASIYKYYYGDGPTAAQDRNKPSYFEQQKLEVAINGYEQLYDLDKTRPSYATETAVKEQKAKLERLFDEYDGKALIAIAEAITKKQQASKAA